MVAGQGAAAGIDDEKHQVSVLHGSQHLPADLGGERRIVGRLKAARVDQIQERPIPFDRDDLAVSGHARGLVDHR